MASPKFDGALLVVAALILPLRLLSLCSRFLLRPDRGQHGAKARSVSLLASFTLLLTAIFAFSDYSSGKDAMVSELETLKHKTAHLESILQESAYTVKSKTLHLEEKDVLISEMEPKIQLLQEELSVIRGSLSDLLHTEEGIRALEEEVQLLSDQSRENNYNVNMLESSTDDAMGKMDFAASEVKKMESIVAEQWIQIQQLEQAFQLTKTMTARVHKRSLQKDHSTSKQHNKYMMTKIQQFFKGIRQSNLPEVVNLPDIFFLGTFSKSCISQLYNQLRRIILLAQKFHYELKELVKHAMEMNKFTAVLSNELVTFLLASALMTIPVISAWSAFL